MKNLLLLAVLVWSILPAHSQSGKFDSTFGKNGYIDVADNPFQAFGAKGDQILVQSDGRLLVLVAGANASIARFNSDGTPDLAFGIGGLIPLDGSFLSVKPGRMALQTDGKIVVANKYNSSLQRFNTDGRADGSFGQAGKVTFSQNLAFEIYTVVIQTDGKIIVAGGHNPGTSVKQQFSLVRYTQNGTLDAGFGNAGQVNTPTGYEYGSVRYMVLRNDGKIVVAGDVHNGTFSPTFLLAQYNTDGSLDNSFGGTGLVKTNMSGGSYQEAALAVQPDGKVLLGATGTLTRYNTDGSFNKAISTGFYEFNAIALGPDGKIVAGGTVFLGTNRYTGESDYDFAITRYLPDGSPDNTFNSNGKVTLGINNPDDLNALAIQPDGKLVLAGGTAVSNFYGLSLYVVARLNLNGSLDNSFRGGGKFIDFPPVFQSGFRAVAVQPDEKIVTAGNGYLYRFNTDGSADNSFSGDGKTNVTTNTSGYISVLVQPDGKILYTGGDRSFALARFKPDGTPDSTFNEDGIIELNGQSSNSYITAVALQTDGKILAAALIAPNGNSSTTPVLVRYTQNGYLDYGFNSSGIIFSPLSAGGNTSGGTVNSVVVQPDGKIALAGSLYDGSKTNFALARFNPDGSPDNSFDGDGKLSAAFGNMNSVAMLLSSRPGGKLIAAGRASPYFDSNYLALAYYNADGSPDNSSGNTGKFISDVAVKSVSNLVETAEKFVLAGTVSNGINDDALLIRFNPDGSPDNNFGDHGKIKADFGRFDLRPSVAFSSNRLYLAEINSSQSYENQDNSGVLAAFFTGPVSPSNPPPATNGLKYRFYQGSWTSLPNFNLLTPVQTGTTPNIDINVRPADVNTNYAFVWEGWITIKTPGDYTFESFSDDGSRFYFNTLYSPAATALINHDGEHYAYAKQETIHIDSAGRYPVAITYFQREEGADMKLYWTGPGVDRQLIPDAAFTDSYQPTVTNGLQYRYYEGTWTSLPDFTVLAPVKTGTTPNIDINVRPAGVNTNYAFLWEGYINIKTPGDYIFETLSDDGSRVYFNSLYSPTAAALIDHDGEHYAYAKAQTIHIDAAGLYPMAVTYFQKEGGAVMQLYWTGPSNSRQLIPDSVFVHSTVSSTNRSADVTDSQHLRAEISPQSVIKMYPNPFAERLNVDINNTVERAIISVDVYDGSGKKVHNQTFRNTPRGRNNLAVNLQGSKLPAGIYHVQVRVNGVLVKSVKLVKTCE